MAKHLTLVIAWDIEQRGPLAVRFAVNVRQARQIAEELWKEYPWSRRISFLKEVDYWFAPEPGSLEEVPTPHPFLSKNGWDVEWRQEQLQAEGQRQAEERDHE